MCFQTQVYFWQDSILNNIIQSHLDWLNIDVYKRQEETSAIPFKKMKPKNEAYNIPRIEKSDCTIKWKAATEEPVSYTHLDVYKRQV